MTFNMVAGAVSSGDSERITVDNKMFKNIQVKDIENYITEDCVCVIDSDTIAFRAAELQQKSFLSVKNKHTEEETILSNITEFKGLTKAISKASWLGGVNIKREASSEEPYTVEDFEITHYAELKNTKDRCLLNIKSFIDDYVQAILKQSGCKKELCLLGEGECHRHKLLLPQKYKGSRTEKPILLPEARQYLTDTYNTEVIKDIEADDMAEIYAIRGTANYLKTGKFNYMISAIDKDARGTPSLLLDYNKDGPIWKNPNPWLIDTTVNSIGEIEYISGQTKCTGLLQICYQLLCGDNIDNYHPYLRFPKELKPKFSYADAAFYSDFCNLETQKEVIQKTIDVYYKFFPCGVKFTAWDGTKVDEDTLWWLETMFSCVYMLRSLDDSTRFSDYVKTFDADISKLVGNNVEKVLDLQEDKVIREELLKVKETLNILSETDYKKSDKKDVLLEKLKNRVNIAEELSKTLENFYK